MSQRWRHEEAAAHGLNHRWRHEDAADHSTLTLNKSVDVHTLGDHPGGWHTNRVSWRAILVSHLAISCRDPNRFGATVWGNGLGQRFGATVRHNLSARPSGVWLGAVLELRHPVKTARRGGVGTPIEKAGARFW